MTMTAEREATKTIEDSIQVEAPIREVYNQWTQFESFPHFMTGIEEIKQIDDTHNHWRASVGGVTREFDTVVTEQVPDERVAWKSTDGETHAGVVTFHRIDENTTKIMLQMDWAPSGAVEKIGSALGFDKRQIHSSLANFKTYIEDLGKAEGGWRGKVEAGNSN